MDPENRLAIPIVSGYAQEDVCPWVTGPKKAAYMASPIVLLGHPGPYAAAILTLAAVSLLAVIFAAVCSEEPWQRESALEVLRILLG